MAYELSAQRTPIPSPERTEATIPAFTSVFNILARKSWGISIERATSRKGTIDPSGTEAR